MEADKCISPSSAAAAKNQVAINDLDNDSLGMIFNKLPYIDRIRIEDVCQRWYAVSEVNWSNYSKTLTITLSRGLLRFCDSPAGRIHIRHNIFKKFLDKSGPYFEQITFYSKDNELVGKFELETMKWIINLCPKLKRIQIRNVILHYEPMDWASVESFCSSLVRHE